MCAVSASAAAIAFWAAFLSVPTQLAAPSMTRFGVYFDPFAKYLSLLMRLTYSVCLAVCSFEPNVSFQPR